MRPAVYFPVDVRSDALRIAWALIKARLQGKRVCKIVVWATPEQVKFRTADMTGAAP